MLVYFIIPAYYNLGLISVASAILGKVRIHQPMDLETINFQVENNVSIGGVSAWPVKAKNRHQLER